MIVGIVMLFVAVISFKAWVTADNNWLEALYFIVFIFFAMTGTIGLWSETRSKKHDQTD